MQHSFDEKRRQFFCGRYYIKSQQMPGQTFFIKMVITPAK